MNKFTFYPLLTKQNLKHNYRNNEGYVERRNWTKVNVLNHICTHLENSKLECICKIRHRLLTENDFTKIWTNHLFATFLYKFYAVMMDAHDLDYIANDFLEKNNA